MMRLFVIYMSAFFIFRNLEEKKEQVINAITEQGKMTDDLKKKILAAETLVAVDDLYRPYRPKKQTRATKAKEKGLEPLANILLFAGNF